MTHFGSQCIHCGLAWDKVPVGDCQGDPKKARPVAYALLGVRWDGVERFRLRMSSGEIVERYAHVSENAPFWQFGYSDTFGAALPYDDGLKIGH